MNIDFNYLMRKLRSNFRILQNNEKIWDDRSENNDKWFIPVSSEEIEDQIQGQIDAGFMIAGFYEDIGHAMFDPYLNIG